MGRGTAARRERRLEMRCTTAVARAAHRQPATAHELQPSTAVRRSGARAAQVADEASATEEPRGVRRRAASPGGPAEALARGGGDVCGTLARRRWWSGDHRDQRRRRSAGPRPQAMMTVAPHSASVP